MTLRPRDGPEPPLSHTSTVPHKHRTARAAIQDERFDRAPFPHQETDDHESHDHRRRRRSASSPDPRSFPGDLGERGPPGVPGAVRRRARGARSGRPSPRRAVPYGGRTTRRGQVDAGGPPRTAGLMRTVFKTNVLVYTFDWQEGPFSHSPHGGGTIRTAAPGSNRMAREWATCVSNTAGPALRSIPNRSATWRAISAARVSGPRSTPGATLSSSA